MTDPEAPTPLRRKRLWRRAGYGLLLLLSLLLLPPALFPTVISSEWARHRAERELSRQLQRNVRIENLGLSWTGIFLLEGLEVLDSPAFSSLPLLELDLLRVEIRPLALLAGNLEAALYVSGVRLELIRGEDGRTNLEALVAATGGKAPAPPKEPEPEPSAEAPAPTVPFRSVDLTVRIDEVAVRMEDRVRQRTAALNDTSLQVDLHPPEYTARAEFRSTLQVEDAEPRPLHLDLTAANALQPDETLTPFAAELELDAALPGVQAQLQGGPGSGGEAAVQLKGRLRLAPGELLAAVTPFLPPGLAGTRAEGLVELVLQGRRDPQDSIGFDLTLTGNALRLAGPLVGGRNMRPLNLHLVQTGDYRLPEDTLALKRGELLLQRHSRLAWAGILQGLTSDTPTADLTLGPATLNLAELHWLAEPFLPSEPSLDWEHTTPRLGWEEARWTGPLAAGSGAPPQRLTLDGLLLEVPRVAVTGAAQPVRATGARVRVDDLVLELREGFPRAVSLEAGAELGALDLEGPQPLSVERLELPGLRLTGRDLTLRNGAGGAPLAGHLELEQALTVGAVSLGNPIRLDGLAQRLAAVCELRPDGGLRLDLPRLELRAEKIHYHGTGDPALALDLEGGPEVPGLRVELDRVGLEGPLPEAPERVGLSGLRVRGNGLKVQQGGQEIATETLSLALRDVTSTLQGQFPRDLALELEAGGDGIAVAGPTPVTLSRFAVPRLSLSLSELALADTALFGVAGVLALEQELQLSELVLPEQVSIPELRLRLALSGRMETGPGAAFRLDDLTVAAPRVSVLPPALELDEPVHASLDLQATCPSVQLAGTEPAAISVEGLALSAGLGELLRLQTRTDARGLGEESLRASGSVQLALAHLNDLPSALRAEGRFAGSAGLEWDLRGRLPNDGERAALQGEPLAALASDTPLPFLEHLDLAVELDGVAADLPVADGERLAVAGISTPSPLSLKVAEQGRTVELTTLLEAPWVESAPGTPPLGEPLDLGLEVRASLQDGDALELDQSFRAVPTGLTQDLHVAVSGLRRLAQDRGVVPSARWLTRLGGELAFSARLEEATALPAADDLQVAGPLLLALESRLVRGEEVSATARLQAEDASLALGKQFSVEGLDGELELSKRLRLEVGGGAEVAADRTFLSEDVLEVASPIDRTQTAATRSGEGSGGGLRVQRLRAAGGPLPLELADLELQFSLADGLPDLQRLQVDWLGGTILSRLDVSRRTERNRSGYQVGGEMTFTGLDAGRLVPGDDSQGESRGPDAEISGQVGFHLPLAGGLDDLLSALELQAGLTHVGPRTLDRALYALDPAESNEAILKQRRLVRLGSPRWVALEARHGNLGVTGEVSVAGAAVALPPLERFPLSRLPGLLDLPPVEEPVAGLHQLLDLLSADRLVLLPSGETRLAHSFGGETP